MAKESEITAVKAVIDKEWPEGATSSDVALAVIKALDSLRGTAQRPCGAPLRVGMAFKPYWSSTTHYVAWIGPTGLHEVPCAWVVTASDDYGTISPLESDFWRFTSPVEEKARTVRKRTRDPETGEWEKDKDGKDAITVVEYDTPGSKVLGVNALGMRRGDKVTFRRSDQYEVEEIFANGVLIRSRRTGRVWAEKNGDLEQYYADGWGRE